MFRRWFIASSFFALLLSGCGGAKSSNDIAKLTKASVVLITAYAEQPEYGTGFFVEGEKGVCTVLTARHVVPVGSKVQLQTNDGKGPWKAVNIKRFPNQDLALVMFKSEGQDCPYKALTLGNSDKVTEGDSIYITGFPGGSSAPQFVHGTVSALTKLTDGYGISYPVITVGGMSGGPVVNTSGEVIAVHGRSEQELTEKAKLAGETLPVQQQSTANINRANGVAQNTFKWGIPSNTYKVNVAAAKSDADTAQEFKELLNSGNDLFASKKYEQAIAAYSKVLQYKPNSLEAWSNRGYALIMLKRYQEALASHDQALQFKPDNPDAWFNRGIALRNLQRYEEAIASYDKAIQLKPDDSLAWNNRGAPLFYLKRYEEALASHDKAIQLKPDNYQAWVGRGAALSNLKRNEDALASYNKAVQLKPDYSLAWHGRGGVLMNLQRYEQAIASFDKALQVNSEWDSKNPADAWFDRGIALRNLQRYEEAIASYDKAIQTNGEWGNTNPAYVWNNRGAALVLLKQYDEALKSFDKAISIKPDYQLAIDNRKKLLTKLGRLNRFG